MNVLESLVVELNLKEKKFTTLSFQEFLLSEENEDTLYWIHCNLNNKHDLNQCIQNLRLPDNVINLCRREEYQPKFLDMGEQLAVRIPCIINPELNKNHEIKFGGTILQLTRRYCFTASFSPIPALINFAESYSKALDFAKTPCFIFFLVFDNIINDYADTLHEYEILAEEIDLRVYKRDHRTLYKKAMFVKKQVLKTKRYANSIRDILMRASGRKIIPVSEACRLSLYNLFNHAQTIVGEADSIRELLHSTLDQIDNALIQKMSNSMQVLTAFAAIFLPLSLIADIHGMSFRWVPELTGKHGYFIALGLMFVCAGGMIIWFKKMKWF